MSEQPYSIDDLCYLMNRLRDPETGCPWDLKQTFSSIVPYTLEEVYEVVDTIERQDYSHLGEELGDLLFQVIFYSQLAQEQSLFDFHQVVANIVEKLVVRHPHVFPEGKLRSERKRGAAPDENAIKATWESIKKAERSDKGHSGILADIPQSLPALTRVAKLQKRAANHGFDWPEVSGVVDKLHEELDELSTAMRDEDSQAMAEELGDVLFTVVNLCRHLGVDSEGALRSSSRKFEKRFGHVEQAARDSDRSVDELSLEEMDQLWQQSKQRSLE
jgi:ATP diphosphatase